MECESTSNLFCNQSPDRLCDYRCHRIDANAVGQYHPPTKVQDRTQVQHALRRLNCQVKCNHALKKTSKRDFQPRHLRGRRLSLATKDVILSLISKRCYYMNAPCSWQPVTGEGHSYSNSGYEVLDVMFKALNFFEHCFFEQIINYVVVHSVNTFLAVNST